MSGGGYARPSVERIDVLVEKGFAQTGDINDAGYNKDGDGENGEWNF